MISHTWQLEEFNAPISETEEAVLETTISIHRFISYDSLEVNLGLAIAHRFKGI